MAEKIYTGKWVTKRGSYYCTKCCAFVKENDTNCKVCGSEFTQTKDESKLTVKTFFKRLLVLLTQPLLIFSQFFFMGSPLFLPPKKISKALGLKKNTKKAAINELLVNVILLIITAAILLYFYKNQNSYYGVNLGQAITVFLVFFVLLLFDSISPIKKYIKLKKIKHS